MKKIWIAGLLFAGILCSLSAQGLYFDVGLGTGKATTQIDGIKLTNEPDLTESCIDFGLKAGYGPVKCTQTYYVGVIHGMGHRFENNLNYVQFTSFLIGPGVIFYPIDLVQLSGAIGLSFVADKTDVPDYSFYSSKRGTAWDISAALDFGKSNHGLLLGLRYFSTSNVLEVTNERQESSIISVFAKYAFRHKIQREKQSPEYGVPLYRSALPRKTPFRRAPAPEALS